MIHRSATRRSKGARSSQTPAIRIKNKRIPTSHRRRRAKAEEIGGEIFVIFAQPGLEHRSARDKLDQCTHHDGPMPSKTDIKILVNRTDYSAAFGMTGEM